MKINKTALIGVAGVVFGLCSSVIDLIQSNRKDDEIAEKAAKIVMEQQSKAKEDS